MNNESTKKGIGSLQINDPGVMRNSKIWFREVSTFALEALFYVPCAGIFRCNADYWVRREYLDSCLLLWIDEGILELNYEGKVYSLEKGMVAVVDGRFPHYYEAKGELEMRWLHFSGVSSFTYMQMLLQRNGPVWKWTGLPELEGYLTRILNKAENSQFYADEHEISLNVHGLLATLFSSNMHVKNPTEQAIDKVTAFIEANYKEDISLDEMAKVAVLSRYYLVRCFKQYKGTTPHEYLLNIRIQRGKKLLYTTNHTLEQIAEQCGFSDVSYFIRIFRKRVSVTPNQFRNLRF